MVSNSFTLDSVFISSCQCINEMENTVLRNPVHNIQTAFCNVQSAITMHTETLKNVSFTHLKYFSFGSVTI